MSVARTLADVSSHPQSGTVNLTIRMFPVAPAGLPCAFCAHAASSARTVHNAVKGESLANRCLSFIRFFSFLLFCFETSFFLLLSTFIIESNTPIRLKLHCSTTLIVPHVGLRGRGPNSGSTKACTRTGIIRSSVYGSIKSQARLIIKDPLTRDGGELKPLTFQRNDPGRIFTFSGSQKASG